MQALDKSARLRSRMMARSEGVEGYAAAQEAAAPRYLCRKLEQVKLFVEG